MWLARREEDGIQKTGIIEWGTSLYQCIVLEENEHLHGIAPIDCYCGFESSGLPFLTTLELPKGKTTRACLCIEIVAMEDSPEQWRPHCSKVLHPPRGRRSS